MAARLEALGVTDDTTLVLVGDTIQFATYIYWALEMTGLAHLATILDGGHQTWAAQGRPMTRDLPPAPARRGTVTPRDPDQSSRVGRDDVLANLQNPNRVLLDVRSPEEYRGERVSPDTAPFDHGAERKGRIPGAVHLYYERLLSEDGTFKTAGEIIDELEAEGASEDRDVIGYCRLSHRATLAWFAATKLAGRHNIRIYDGSWTEWGSIVGFPVER
jgi:thiosulfate/3-mercaptopyruvate sulfurtransferase